MNFLDLADNWLEEAGGRAVADMLKENLYITELVCMEDRLANS